MQARGFCFFGARSKNEGDLSHGAGFVSVWGAQTPCFFSLIRDHPHGLELGLYEKEKGNEIVVPLQFQKNFIRQGDMVRLLDRSFEIDAAINGDTDSILPALPVNDGMVQSSLLGVITSRATSSFVIGCMASTPQSCRKMLGGWLLFLFLIPLSAPGGVLTSLTMPKTETMMSTPMMPQNMNISILHGVILSQGNAITRRSQRLIDIYRPRDKQDSADR